MGRLEFIWGTGLPAALYAALRLAATLAGGRSRMTERRRSYGTCRSEMQAEVARGKLHGEFKLTLSGSSSNKDRKGILPRRVPDEEPEVPVRRRSGASFVRDVRHSR